MYNIPCSQTTGDRNCLEPLNYMPILLTGNLKWCYSAYYCLNMHTLYIDDFYVCVLPHFVANIRYNMKSWGMRLCLQVLVYEFKAQVLLYTQIASSHFQDVKYILVDPSCSGSGISNRIEYNKNQLVSDTTIYSW